jgi:hypothetical protein
LEKSNIRYGYIVTNVSKEHIPSTPKVETVRSSALVRQFLFEKHLLIYSEDTCIEGRRKNTSHASRPLRLALS